MNKNQGLTVGTILLAAGLITRSASTNQFEPRKAPRRVSTAATQSTAAHESDAVGPWVASCNYWASATPSPRDHEASQSIADDDKEDSNQPTGKQSSTVESHRQSFLGEVQQPNKAIDLKFRLEQLSADQEDKELGCENTDDTKWGFPSDHGMVNVKTIIAIVPDPVHTHLAMVFDRTIAALLLAAQNNGYLNTFYWVPWREHSTVEDGVAIDVEGKEPGHDPIRERQPGLLVLKSNTGFNKVIYLFLVGESPTEGVNGSQLQNAFQYEKDVRRLVGNRNGQFSSGRDGHVSIIGPTYTGSATSLLAGIEAEARNRNHLQHSTDIFDVSGSTSTAAAAKILNTDSWMIKFNSFDGDEQYYRDEFLKRLATSGYDLRRVAILSESSTSFGGLLLEESNRDKRKEIGESSVLPLPLILRFPREISLLRNARGAGESERSGSTDDKAPSPFLRLSLKDSSPTDSIPLFSHENTPLSQESQLMAISRELHRYRIQYVAIVASNPLDSMFLAQFLHRTNPDARLLLFQGDLLMEREIDNVPFVGTTTVTPYPLISLTDTTDFPFSDSEAYYNAASFTIWQSDPKTTSLLSSPLPVKGYFPVVLTNNRRSDLTQPRLWVTAIGTDGYYPLGILSPCASGLDHMAPAVGPNGDIQRSFCPEDGAVITLGTTKTPRTIWPSLLWDLMCICTFGLCLAHFFMLLVADYWSPVTRDLAIEQNDRPDKRSMYVNVAMAMLFSAACVIALPILAIDLTVNISKYALVLSWFTLGAGVAATAASLCKVRKFSGPAGKHRPRSGWIEWLHGSISDNICFFISVIAWVAGSGIPILWWCLCRQERGDAGVFFCYRSINPGSGVSPLVPVLLLLLGWYVWAFFQTRRMRFSEFERPRLPLASEASTDNRFFVSDEDLCSSDGHVRNGLMRYASCLFITRESLSRALSDTSKRSKYALDFSLLLLYLAGLIYFSAFDPIRSLNHLFWAHQHISDPFEILMGLLFFPLVVVALAAWLRTILMWGALRNGLLERLENQPIRLAFSRLKGFGWMGMLRQSGLHEQLRDMARSVESIRYVLHEEDVKNTLSIEDWSGLNNLNSSLVETIEELRKLLAAKDDHGPQHFKLVRRIEENFSLIGRALLTKLLVPYWQHERTGLVDGAEMEELPMKARRWEMRGETPNFPIRFRATPESADPAGLIVAQEFVALRYVALVRAALANLRNLLAFISVAFVLCIVAWHAYPFQPRQQVDWLCTGLFFVLGTGIVWVLAQMYRNPILSRITDTHPNELGWEFYLRILAFGAIPILTWLAYQFPDIGSMVFNLFQPAVAVMK